MNTLLNYEDIVHIAKFSNFKTLLNISYISKFFNSVLYNKLKKRFNKLSWTLIIEYTTKYNIKIKNISLTLGTPFKFRYNKKILLYIGKIKDIIDYFKTFQMCITIHINNNDISLINNYQDHKNGYYYYQTVIPVMGNLDETFNSYNYFNAKIPLYKKYINKLPYNCDMMIKYNYKNIQQFTTKNE